MTRPTTEDRRLTEGRRDRAVSVWIVTCVFPPEHAPAGHNASELAEDLAHSGHNVTVLTGWPSHPEGTIYPGWTVRRGFREMTKEGFTVVRCRHFLGRRFGLARKLWYYVTFAISSFFVGLRLSPRPDIIVIQSTPIFGALSAILLAKLRRAKTFRWIHDVHPEGAINAGVLREGLVTRLILALDTWNCRQSDQVGTLTESMQGLLRRRGLPAEHVVIQRHWVDESRIFPSNRLNAWRERHGIPADAFVVLHAGTIGYISGAEVIIEAAKRLGDCGKILFLFVGEGPMKGRLEARVRDLGLQTVRFLPFQTDADLNLMQATGDLGLVTLLASTGESSIPSKMHGYTAAGRPVIASVAEDSPTAVLVRENSVGWVVPPEDPEALAAAIRRADQDRDECLARGHRAREFFLREFGRSEQTKQFEEYLLALCAKER